MLASVVMLSGCNVKLTTSESADRENKNVNAGWETYKNDKYGYSIQHPKGWTVTDKSSGNTRQTYVYEPTKKAYVKIDAYADKKVDSALAMKSLAQVLKKRITAEPGMILKKFNDSVEGEVGGHIAIGEQTINDELFLFENRGLYSTNGRVLLFHRTVKKDAFSELDETLTKIIKSFILE